jgi:hypothetical protein
MLTPVTKAKTGAMPHIKTVLVWPLDSFREWAGAALRTVRDLRKTFLSAGDVEWKANALDTYRKMAISPAALQAKLVTISAGVKWIEVK